ncbi:HAD family hydrolase [Desulfocurvus sp.]|jgi:D-glycero-D-manno-heptose 1,7-bisphosphate phosphatase|uniref:D-glycero-alpha-D-manno-heptose-1,7-bisphosphate 7-phosphatase n=1 Tax=Desulfocurvus sp. TaxID=2871698 RepID=UPI0025C1D2E8|nr:HAD family hydrolase [Desulfocurvus sp.]MCK9241156.1 HAD-IIIA family hydrolase [Desulfocurvus sp.]
MKPITDLILDRDGTIIVDRHYLADPAGVELLPGAGQALARLASAGVRLHLASNQSGIGRGRFTEADLRAVHARLEELLAKFGVRLAGVAHCPHAPEAACPCRKPATGMWLALARAQGLDPAATAMVGDKDADVGLGLAAGLAASILVLTGKGAAHAARMGLAEPRGPWREIAPRAPGQPHLLARDLAGAADWLLARGAGAREARP